MDTLLLTVLREVARTGSFTGASTALGYTQSAVSRQIAALEHELGTVLFDRGARGVRLTDEGRCVLEHAEAVLDRISRIRDDLRALREADAGHVRVGAFATSFATLVPDALAAFRVAHPGVTVTLVEGLTRNLIARLRTGDVDLALVTSSHEDPPDDLELRFLTNDPLYVALAAGHPLSGRGPLRLADLAGESWIASSARTETTLIDELPAGLERPRVEFVVGEWTAKLGLVAAGLGVTLIPSLAAGAMRADVTLAALHPEDSPVRSVYVATPVGRTQPAAVAIFHRFLEASAAGLTARLRGDARLGG